MNIKPSASIRNNYNEISKLCKSTGEPVYLTKSGEGDLVVMDIEAFSRREKMLALRATESTGQNTILLMKWMLNCEGRLRRRRSMDGQRYRVLISDKARQMMKAHVSFLAEVNPQAAEKLRVSLMEGIRSLAQMPERCPYLDEEDRRSPYRKLHIPKWYLVIYVVVDDTVYVEYIVDARQEYGWLLR